MALRRYSIDIAFKLPLSSATQTLLTEMETKVKALKARASLLSAEGSPKIRWHKCFHDEGGQPCEPEQEL